MSENTYRCRSCGWEGNQLRKTGCLTYADTWYVCPSCNQGASECISILNNIEDDLVKQSDRNKPAQGSKKIGAVGNRAGMPPGV